jgi:8-oxo-dGTP diphosphatase
MSQRKYTYEYPRPAVTVDCVTFGLDENSLKILLIQRNAEPFANCWALPGGFVDMDEDLEHAARRELEEETCVRLSYLEQLYTFGSPDRDPRGRVISVAYFALVNLADHAITAASDARNVGWFAADQLPKLAFDHDQIIQAARERLQGKVRYQPIGFDLLPRKFTLSQLQHLYELLLNRKLDKRNFRKKILAMKLLVELDQVQQNVPHRAAQLYRFDKRAYGRLIKSGFLFEI